MSEGVTPPGEDAIVKRDTDSETSPPIFEYVVRLCETFEDVLDQVGDSIGVRALAEVALDAGRLLIQAPGGAGKTTTMERAALAASEAGVRSIWVWAVAWVSTATTRHRQVEIGALEDVLGVVTDPKIDPKTFADGRPTILFVDGLNELQAGYADLLISAVDRLAARYPQLGVILADRLVRRSVGSDWQLATLTPVPEWQIRDLVGPDVSEAQLGLLGNPFFLDRARRQPLSARTHRAFLTSQLGVSAEELRTLAAAVNGQYRERGDRLMTTSSLVQAVSAGLVERLIAAGTLTLRGMGTECFFSHHLLSDFLAALDLADAPQRWAPQDFNDLTFQAASFDALQMLLDEVTDRDVDTLIRRVYDWNLYGAAYVLAQDDISERRISVTVRTAMLALLAERRFDRLLASAGQASDALRLQRSRIAAVLREVHEVDGVMSTVASLNETSPWFEEWQALFLAESNPQLDILRYLESPDGILGWTAANVLKRRFLSRSDTRRTIELLTDGEPSVRWRAAHVLGRSQDRDAVDALLESIKSDDYMWVSYGALRSLIEVASSIEEQEEREYIFLGLAALAPVISSKPYLAREVERSLRVRSMPTSWPEDAGLLLERLWAMADTVDEQDRWRRISADLRTAAA